MLNHIEMVFSEGDNDTETCAKAIRIAEQDARDRAIEALKYTFDVINNVHPMSELDRCYLLGVFSKHYDK